MDRKSIVAGSILSVFRVSCLWMGSFWLTNTSDYRQVISYFLLVFTLPEAVIVSGLRKALLIWKLSLSLFLIMGSFILVYILCFVFKNKRSAIHD